MNFQNTTGKDVSLSASFAFTNASRGIYASPAQQAATKECQQPLTPYKITDEDWKYGIGLN